MPTADLDANVDMNTTDTEISDILNDKIKHLLPRCKKQFCAEVKIRANLSLDLYFGFKIRHEVKL